MGRKRNEPDNDNVATNFSTNSSTKRKLGESTGSSNGHHYTNNTNLVTTRTSKRACVTPSQKPSSTLKYEGRASKVLPNTSTAMEIDEKRIETNGKLQPKPDLTFYEKDPTFESKMELPFISTLAHSRLLIRAVILNDMKLFNKLINEEPHKIYTLGMPRSSRNAGNVLNYTIKHENKEAFKILHGISSKTLEKFGCSPSLTISEEETGHQSHTMFGQGMKQVSVGRGGKEGNNAFLYDIKSAYQLPASLDFDGSDINRMALKMGVSTEYMDFLMNELKMQHWDYYSIHIPLQMGHYELAGKAISKANLKGGYGFNLLHEEALMKISGDDLTPFKPLSVTKKCIYDTRFTPLHCAAINPKVDVLITLLGSMPDITDFNSADQHGWTVGHYAAVCSGPDPLKYLLEVGISTHATTSTKKGGDGYTLLHAAVSAGRAHNVKVILEHEDEKAEVLKNDLRYKLTTKGQNALHMASELGHFEILKLLLESGINGERSTPRRYGRVTPLMIASMFGHLDLVKILVESEMNVEARDRRGRTAAHHAAMNGHTHVLSYLLRLGVNHLAVDSSGNTLLHYSAAYGWYFATMLLLEAGCPPNASNYWKLTPVAIAFMKGHTGLVTELMKKEGVDVNARVDEQGRTLFLEMCKVEVDIDRVKHLVEDLKADPTCEDFKGNNALHYMAEKQLKIYMPTYPKEVKSFNECISYLVQKGCDPFKINLTGSSSILKAAESSNFLFLSKILVDLKMGLRFEKDASDNTFLHFMSQHLAQNNSMVHSVFKKLCENQGDLSALKKMANTFNTNGYTPMLQLLNTKFTIPMKISNVVDTFLQKLNVDVNAKVKNSESPLTALHLAIREGSTDILETILKYNPNLDPVDENLRTPLAIAIMNGDHKAAEKLIDAGSNVNFKIQSEHGISLVLLAAMKETKSFSLIPKLISKGADCSEIHPETKNTIIHYISSKPVISHTAEALNAVLNAGVNPNLTNSNGMTALHLSVNARGRETNAFYDVEDILITSNADLTIQDNFGRIPLHYAFVKLENPKDSTFFDPIELVSHLVTSMQNCDAGDKIHSVDMYGATALHYSAFRGATICSSNLLQTLKDGEIDICDKNGNTAFGLSVRNKHEACSLNFYQKGASFLRNIKSLDIFPQKVTTSERPPKKEPWRWSHNIEEEEEGKRLQKEQETYPILEQVIKNDWQGMLYLMIAQIQSSRIGFSTAIATALKTKRLNLALKLAMHVRHKEISIEGGGTLFHILAKYYDGGDEDLVMEICENFRKNGLDSTIVDGFGSHPVIYALINHQHNLCGVLLPNSKDLMKTLASLKPDKFGRTPFTALFWSCNKSLPGNGPLQQFAEKLLAAGANPNELCEYPLELVNYPVVRFRKRLVNIKPSTKWTRYSSLITAVIAQSYDTVKWLLNIKSRSNTVVNVNGQDSEGRTPLMHAIRLNDVQMVKLLLDPVNYNYVDDVDGETFPEVKSSKADITIRDMHGQTAMDYLITSPGKNCYYKNVQLTFDILQSMNAVHTTSGDGATPLDRAIQHKRHDILQMLSKHVQLSQHQLTLSFPEEFTFSQDIFLSPIPDYPAAAEKMAEKLLQKEKESLEQRGEEDSLKPQPDPLCGLDTSNAEVMLDPQQNIPFDCHLTKVDINYGMYGLYNFYKMQIIRQPRGKEMIILFTQWGRVGTTGQYQKTPYPTEEEAIKDFRKIFYTKSGNAWEDVQNFRRIPSKYRLVSKDLRFVKHSTEVKIDFDELDKAGKNFKSSSLLNESTTTLIRKLALVHRTSPESNCNNGGGFIPSDQQTQADHVTLPLLSRDVVLQGEKLLKEIRRTIRKDIADRGDTTTGKSTEKEKADAMNHIVKCSEEFYSIIPVIGYSTEKLKPIALEDDLREKMFDIEQLLHLGSTKSLLLAAQFNQMTTNPFEYIYKCLGTRIQLLDRSNAMDGLEADLILQYIYNTGDENVKVHGIYKVDIPSENGRLNATNLQNRQLLWHGTSSANMLSILQEGLQVAPLGAQISDVLFGQGIYLADMFTKSQHYTRSVKVDGKLRKYMLLCETALGKVWEVNLHHVSENTMPPGYNSLKTSDSRYEPDPESTVLYKGRVVALGAQKENRDAEIFGWGLDYNEYIIFNVDQVAVRYLVEFEEGSGSEEKSLL